MFTSRAEYRLLLREDNADLRLTEIGHSISLATAEAYKRVTAKKSETSMLIDLLEHKQISPTLAINTRLEAMGSAPIRNQTSLAQLLRRPEISVSDITTFSGELASFAPDVTLQAEVEVKYDISIDKWRWLSGVMTKCPPPRRSNDQRSKNHAGLRKAHQNKARSLGQASRISGITLRQYHYSQFIAERKSA
jgi:tRNA uridine 5-carboxymethylaminomethyl modification enzyme